MFAKSVYVLLVALTPMILALDEKNEPMVAFLCNRPSMYRTEQGWVKDDNTGCLRDPVDILNYCRKVFPHHDVRNVVEGNDRVTIDNWCAFGHKTCRHQFTVRPFRCLVGPFQSDALLVPEHCIFDHVHDSKLCTSYGEWNKTATQSCSGRSMQLQRFSMLQPCGIDRFNGVEFVCCPTPAAADDSSSKDDDTYDDEIEERTTQRATPPTTTTPAAVVDDAFSAYIRRIGGKGAAAKNGHKWNEHDYYMKAMEDMRRHHEDKINKMMKEWAAARQRVQELKSRDPKAAEKLNKEITARFQKTYDSMEVENMFEKKQLSNLHQQRVQAELNEKKRRALDDYMQAIDDNRDPAEILRSLKQYIKVVQKDRLHTVDRYNHLRDTDPAEAESIRPQMADHLRTIDQQMTMTLDLLNRVPKYQKKIQLQINDYLDAYHAIDSRVAVLLRSLADNPPTTPAPAIEKKKNQEENYEADGSDYSEDDEEAERDERDEEENTADEDYDENYKDGDDSRDDTVDSVKPNEEQKVAKTEKVEKLPVVKKVGGLEDVATVTPLVVDVSDDKKPAVSEEDEYEDDYGGEDEDDDEDKDEETKETESENDEDEENDDSRDDDEEDDAEVEQPTVYKKDNGQETENIDHDLLQDPEPAHIDKSYINVKEPYISKAPNKSVNSINAAVPLGITVSVIAILVVIVAGVVIKRRRASRRSLRSSVNVRLDPTATPEERHIASMQMTGYENPTYKYFEMSGTASA